MRIGGGGVDYGEPVVILLGSVGGRLRYGLTQGFLLTLDQARILSSDSFRHRDRDG